MSDDTDDNYGILKGDLMKVIHVDELSETVYFRLFDGRTSRMTGLAEGILQKNDVILSDGNDWTVVPNEVWPTSFLTSVIRDVLEDGTILGESGNAVLRLSNSQEISVSANCTVEIDGRQIFSGYYRMSQSEYGQI